MLRTLLPVILAGFTALNGAPLKQAKIKTRAAIVYQDILDDSEVLFMFRKGEIATLLDKKVDVNDKLWYQVSNSGGEKGWVESENLALGAGSPKARGEQGKKTLSRRTVKERRMYVKNHPDLERRFKKFIKEGFVGIGMTPENVTASLGEPDIKRTVFLLDRGKLPVWIYNPENPTVILFEKNRVKGWTRE